MTIAQDILNQHKNYTDALLAAGKIYVDTDNNFDTEVSIFIFEDGSKLKADGVAQEIKVVK